MVKTECFPARIRKKRDVHSPPFYLTDMQGPSQGNEAQGNYHTVPQGNLKSYIHHSLVYGSKTKGNVPSPCGKH